MGRVGSACPDAAATRCVGENDWGARRSSILGGGALRAPPTRVEVVLDTLARAPAGLPLAPTVALATHGTVDRAGAFLRAARAWPVKVPRNT